MKLIEVIVSLNQGADIAEVPIYASYIPILSDKTLSDMVVRIKDMNGGEMNYVPEENYLRIIHFLLGEIGNIAIDGDDFDFEKGKKLLLPIGIDIETEYFQP